MWGYVGGQKGGCVTVARGSDAVLERGAVPGRDTVPELVEGSAVVNISVRVGWSGYSRPVGLVQ